MSTNPELREFDGGAIGNRASDPFDTGFYFERWLNDLNGGWQHLPPDVAEGAEDSEFYIGSFPGSNCELSFEGVLNFDGYSYGPINSPDGTLVLTQRGRIEADINVRIAIINGWVTGNIIASERVVLESEAKVMGQIYTPALTTRIGAIFEGECLTSPDARSPETASERLTSGRYRGDDLAVAAGV